MKVAQNLKSPVRQTLQDLTPEQQATLEKWLHEDHLSHKEIASLCVKEFNLKVSVKSITVFFGQQSQQHIIARIIKSAENANAVVKAFSENPADTYQALLKVAGQIAFEKAINKPKPADIAVIREFTKLLISARHEDLMAQRFSHDREKWEFDIARDCLKHLAHLQSIAADQALDEDARILAIRQRLFGVDLPA